MGIKFPEKKRYVTLEWPLTLCDRLNLRLADRQVDDFPFSIQSTLLYALLRLTCKCFRPAMLVQFKNFSTRLPGSNHWATAPRWFSPHLSVNIICMSATLNLNLSFDILPMSTFHARNRIQTESIVESVKWASQTASNLRIFSLRSWPTLVCKTCRRVLKLAATHPYCRHKQFLLCPKIVSPGCAVNSVALRVNLFGFLERPWARSGSRSNKSNYVTRWQHVIFIE